MQHKVHYINPRPPLNFKIWFNYAYYNILNMSMKILKILTTFKLKSKSMIDIHIKVLSGESCSTARPNNESTSKFLMWVARQIDEY